MQGLAGVPAEEIDHLKESVLDLAGETARSPQELAEALYGAASAGLDSAQAMEAVDIAARAAAAGLGRTDDIVGLVASATASYGAANIDAAEAVDIVTATIRAGRADPDELAGSLGRILPIANNLGVSFDDVGGAVAYLSNAFGDTGRTVTSMSGLLTKLASPTQQGRDALYEMGTSVEELHAAIDQDGLMGALDVLREHGFVENQRALNMLFDDVEARQGALTLLSDQSGTLAATMDEVGNSAGAAQEAIAAIDTDAQALTQAWVDIQRALIQVGDIIGPVAADFAGGISTITGAFSDMPGAMQYAIVGVGAFVAALGPMLRIGGAIVTNLAAIRGGLVLLKAAMLGHPILAFAGIAASVGAAVYMMASDVDHAAKATDALAESMTNAGDAGKGLADYLLNMKGADVLIDAMDKAGVTITELSEAALAGGPAWEEMSSKLHATGVSGGELVDGLSVLEVQLQALPGLAANATAEMDKRARVDDTAAAASEGASEALDNMSASLELSAEQAEAAAAAQQELIDTMFDAISRVFDYESATLSLADAVADYADQELETAMIVLDSTRTAEEKEAAMRDLRQAEIGTAESALATAEAYAREKGAMDGTAKSADLQIIKLAELADQYPHLRDEIGVYIGKLSEIPGAVDTRASLDASQAYGEIDSLNDRLYRLRMLAAGIRVGGGVVTNPSGNAPIARAGGGPVMAGRLYEVGEGNVAEMYMSGGRQYMIPGNNGQVFSGAQVAAFATSSTVTTNHHGPTINMTVNTTADDAARAVRHELNLIMWQLRAGVR